MRILALGCVLGLAASAPASAQDVKIVGWIEPVLLADAGVELEAKLDTGADNSSLDARDIRSFERDGRSWVSFDVVDRKGNTLRLERPLERTASIARASGGRQLRPVIRLEICLDGVLRASEVNLVDRGRLKLPMLLGRSFLEGQFAVDSGRTHTTTPGCARTGR